MVGMRMNSSITIRLEMTEMTKKKQEHLILIMVTQVSEED